MVVGLAALCCASCHGCNHNGASDGGGGSGGSDGGVPDLAVPPGACNSDPDCGDAAQRCCDKVCVETADCALSVTSLTAANGFQNGGDFVTLHGNGFAAGMKVFIADGRAPVRVVLSSTRGSPIARRAWRWRGSRSRCRWCAATIPASP